MASKPFPVYDVFLDVPHPATSISSDSNIKYGTIIIAPPPGPALEASMAVGKELVGDDRAIARIARFAFPDFNDSVWAQEVAANPPIPNSGAGLNKYDINFLEYCSPKLLTSIKKQNPYCTGSSYFTFALQLTSGARVHGHVKRYLPHNNQTMGRIDIGRRSVRALILLTRGSGGEQFYSSLLKTIEGISSINVSFGTEKDKSHKQAFLHQIFHEHQRVCAEYASRNAQQVISANESESSQNSKPSRLVVPSLEFQNPYFSSVDTCKFVVPSTLLHSIPDQDSIVSFSNYRLLPLLRCLGVSETLRLLSALLCERRIILLSQSPARLSGCARAALSILAQGLLYWQHIFVPILPPGMISHLAAPMPYLVGLMSNHASVIPSIPGIGEVLIINLDTNELSTQNIQFPNSEIPDLMRPAMEQYIGDGENREKYKSVAEILAQDLVEVTKVDKKLRSGGENVVAEKLGNAAGKGKVMLKKSFAIFKSKYGKQQSTTSNTENNDTNDEQQEEPASESPGIFSDEMYAFDEGYENEAAEEEARIAFSSFFLTMIGDVKWYLRPPSQAGADPTLDKVLFMQSRARFGDMEGSPMYALLTYFRESQLFEEFVKARIQEIRLRKPLSGDEGAFSLTSNYLRVHRINFSPLDVRRVIRQVCSSNPSRFLIQWNADVRRRAMALTSNSRQEHLVQVELVRLVKDCREGSSVLVDVMGVIWIRLQDCKGMQWKHGLYAMQMLRELLLHGPVAAVIEASDGINIINKMKSYENSLRANVTLQLRRYANLIYDLLVNRSKLFSQRKAAVHKRFELLNPLPPKRKIPNPKLMMKFVELHTILAPYGAKVSCSGAKVAPNRMQTTSATAVSPAPVTDLLGFDFILRNAPSISEFPVRSAATPTIAQIPVQRNAVPTIAQIPVQTHTGPTIAQIPVRSNHTLSQASSVTPKPQQQGVFDTSTLHSALPPENSNFPSKIEPQTQNPNRSTPQPAMAPAPTQYRPATLNSPATPQHFNNAQPNALQQNSGMVYNAVPASFSQSLVQQTNYGNQITGHYSQQTPGYVTTGQQNINQMTTVLPAAQHQPQPQYQVAASHDQFSQVSSPPQSSNMGHKLQFDPFAN